MTATGSLSEFPLLAKHALTLPVCFRDRGSTLLMADDGWKADGQLFRRISVKKTSSTTGLTSGAASTAPLRIPLSFRGQSLHGSSSACLRVPCASTHAAHISRQAVHCLFLAHGPCSALDAQCQNALPLFGVQIEITSFNRDAAIRWRGCYDRRHRDSGSGDEGMDTIHRGFLREGCPQIRATIPCKSLPREIHAARFRKPTGRFRITPF